MTFTIPRVYPSPSKQMAHNYLHSRNSRHYLFLHPLRQDQIPPAIITRHWTSFILSNAILSANPIADAGHFFAFYFLGSTYAPQTLWCLWTSIITAHNVKLQVIAIIFQDSFDFAFIMWWLLIYKLRSSLFLLGLLRYRHDTSCCCGAYRRNLIQLIRKRLLKWCAKCVVRTNGGLVFPDWVCLPRGSCAN